MTHERWADSAGAYLLGALPDDEREGYEVHLADCATCRNEVDELAPAVHALPASVEPVDPPASLRARIMAEVEREATLLAAAGPEADRPAPRREPRQRRRFASLLWPRLGVAALAVTLLVVGVGAGIVATGLNDDAGQTVAATVDERRASGATVDMEVSSDGGVVLVARGLPAPPSNRVYQVWLKRPGQAPEPTSALFTPSRDGTATATVPGPLEDVEQVMITDEPRGGSQIPTRDPLAVAEMS